MKFYSEEQVEKIVRDVVIATAQGIQEWYASDHVFIVDKTTKARIDNCEIDCDNANVPLTGFIYPLLAQKGIKFYTEDTPENHK